MKIKLKSNPARLRDPKPQPVKTWREGLGSSARGYDYQWQIYRRDYLRAHPVCMIKGKGCELAATVVDHIIPHRGNRRLFTDPSNHQAACAHCHSAHKQRQELGL